jgi:glycolate oxidase iron-sulfur subunit
MGTKPELNELNRVKKDLDKCIRCGFCASCCPVYRAERDEASLARGKNRIMKGLVAGEFEFSDDMAEILNKCIGCGTCTQNCPTSSPIASLVVSARADKVANKGLSFTDRMLYRWLLPKRTLFGNVVKTASVLQKIFMPKTEGNIRHLPFFLSGLGKGRNVPQIAPKFLRQLVPEINLPPEGIDTKYTIGYFTGCMTDFVFPELGKIIINFLNKNGVKVVVPRGQGCCGAPVFLGAGDFITGREIADKNVASLRGFDYIITDCATCASSMKDYVKFLADNDERKKNYTEFGTRIKDITEFLVDVLKLPPSAYQVADEFKGKRVTWHEPCHLGKHLGIKEQPIKILKSLSDIQFVEMPDADRCCGMGGSFSIKYYALSQKIAEDKVKDIASTQADIVVTDCPGCQVQLIDSIKRHEMPQKVMHIMELFK